MANKILTITLYVDVCILCIGSFDTNKTIRCGVVEKEKSVVVWYIHL